MQIIKPIFLLLIASAVFSCQKQEVLADAYGNFEGDPVSVSAEANGKLLKFSVQEGAELKAGELVGIVDTTLLVLQKARLDAAIKAVKAKTKDPSPEIAVLREKKSTIVVEKNRVEALLKNQAATPKQLDDINAKIAIIDRQIEAAQRSAQLANAAILSEVGPLKAQVNQLNEQIAKCYIYNPVKGTVLTKLAEEAEVTGFGRPLYRIANLEMITLRAYITGKQLTSVKIGDKAEVVVDTGVASSKRFNGTITWVAQVSEFTPKSIQTKDERANLVYAIKIKVPNDGTLKIGMPAEVNFAGSQKKVATDE